MKEKWQSTDGFGRHENAMGINEGVYVIMHFDVLTRKSLVIYVGRSLNLKSRWKSHNIFKQSFKDGYFSGVKWKICKNSAELEYKLINRLKPIYNKQLING